MMRAASFVRRPLLPRRLVSVASLVEPALSPKAFATGTMAVLAGIAFLTLNERRDVAQAKLRAQAEAVALSLRETEVTSVDSTISGRLLHYCGSLHADGEQLKDEELGVSSPGAVALTRTVEMRQWRETAQTKVDPKTNEKVKSYSYEAVWSPVHEKVEGDAAYRNPEFPSGLDGGTLTLLPSQMMLGRHDKLVLNDALVQQVRDFKPLPLRRDNMDAPKDLPFGLTLSGGLLTNSKNLVGYSIGDLRVRYDAVVEGPYTAVAKLEVQEDANYLVPFSASLRNSLASQGKIEVPEDVERTLGVKLDTFIIPESIISHVRTSGLRWASVTLQFHRWSLCC